MQHFLIAGTTKESVLKNPTKTIAKRRRRLLGQGGRNGGNRPPKPIQI